MIVKLPETPNSTVRPVVTHVAAAVAGALLVGLLALLLSRPAPAPAPSPSPDPLHASPGEYDWRRLPAPEFPVPNYARFLEGAKIVLDPGHGGRADRPNWKRGPTGLREAEVNLSVARFLRDFLAAAGAEVVMTRDDDVYLHVEDAKDLSMRIDIANRMRADLFLSIHHNAADRATANYTSVFFHGRPEDNPASVDAARNLVSGLDDALRLEQRIGVALVSDFEIAPRVGFRVLREARVPAVLSEASFHSNPEEEQRLRDPLYNRREAYGLFLGLARWAQAGLPRVTVGGNPSSRKPGAPLVLRLDDGLSHRGGLGSGQRNIRSSSIVVRLGDKPLDFRFDARRSELHVTLPSRLPSDARLYVDFKNTFGQHVLHPWIDLSTDR